MDTDLETQIMVDILNLKELLKKATELNRHQDTLNMYQCMIEVKNDELNQFKCVEEFQEKRTLQRPMRLQDRF